MNDLLRRYGVGLTTVFILLTAFWLLILVVSVKYLSFVMRADNAGEGGILTLMSLATRNASPRWTPVLIILGLIGGSFFYGEVVITPAMSVMSAIEGLSLMAPSLDPYIVPLSVLVLTLLFAIQKHGTAMVGKLFAPIMLIWFMTLAVLGLRGIIHNPEVLGALNPVWAVRFFVQYQTTSFFALGAVVLAITGVEALYADMGHFGKNPIRLAWFVVVLPSLVLNYFGQGALLLDNPAAIANPFFLLAPKWALLPLLVLATMATVIASQAVISGVFSLTRQAVRLGYLSPIRIVHTSEQESGQIYIPVINWMLYISVVIVIMSFEHSSNLAAAYGIAVTGTMVLTSILFCSVAKNSWRWPTYLVAALFALLLPHTAPAQGSRGYTTLVSQFTEWRAFEEPPRVEGAPDYTAATNARRLAELGRFRQRLLAIDTTGWSCSARGMVMGRYGGVPFIADSLGARH